MKTMRCRENGYYWLRYKDISFVRKTNCKCNDSFIKGIHKEIKYQIDYTEDKRGNCYIITIGGYLGKSIKKSEIRKYLKSLSFNKSFEEHLK